MAGQQDIVLAPVSLLPASTSPNPADIICYSWDVTPSNIILNPVNGPQVPGRVSIVLIPLPAWVPPAQVTLTMFPITPPVFSLLPNPADITLIGLPAATLPSLSNPADIISYLFDSTPSNIILNSTKQTGNPGPIINNITMIPLSQSVKAAPQLTVVLYPLGYTPPTQNISYYGKLKRWTNSTWIKEPLKRWNGSSWTLAKLKRWTGAIWGLIDTTGV